MSGRALASAPSALCHGPDRAHLYWGRGFHSSGEKGAEGGPEGPLWATSLGPLCAVAWMTWVFLLASFLF